MTDINGKSLLDGIVSPGTLIRTMLETADEGFLALGCPDFRILEVSDRFCRMSGFNREELMGKRFPDLDIFRGCSCGEVIAEKLRGNRFEEFEFFCRKKDGTGFFAEVFASYLNESGGLYILFVKDVTFHKNDIAKLQYSHDLMQYIIEHNKTAIAVHDKNMNYIYVSRRYREDFNLDDEKILGKNHYEVFPELPENLRVVHRRVLSGEVISAEEDPYIRSDGSTGWTRWECRPWYEENGDIGGIIVYTEEITDRIMAGEKLQETNNLLTNLARLVPGVIYQYRLYPDGHSSFPYASPGIKAIYEVTPEEVKDDATVVFGRLHPEDYDHVASKIGESARTLETFYCEFRVILPEQGLRWRWSQAQPVRLEDGGTLWHGIISDITERKLAEQEAADERERLSVTLRSIGDGVISADLDGRVVNINPAAERMTGWQRTEAKGKPFADVFRAVRDRTGEACPDMAASVLADGILAESEGEVLLISRNGEERMISASGSPILDASSRIIGTVIVFKDMTERQKMLLAMQRTARLDSLGVLAGGIAHDFNNLLGGIFGYLDLAEKKCTDSIKCDYITRALKVIDRARALTGQLLTFARGGTPMKKAEKLFPFVRETAEFALSGTNVKCGFFVPDDLWVCEFDKNQIGQVIENLVINASQAMEHGGEMSISASNMRVAVTVSPTRSPGNYVKIDVEDSGSGMPPEVVERIFDPFFTTKEQGHGLGLATSYSIIEKHGGFMEVDSVPGQGTVFSLYLPAVMGEAVSDFEMSACVHRGTGDILVMDDEQAILEVTSDMLSSFGYNPITAVDGKEALDIFVNDYNGSRRIRGMIFDLTVPGGIGGLDTVARVRKISGSIPVIVCSGYAEDPVMARPSRYGFTASLRKPFRSSELADILEKHIGSAS